MQYFTYTQPTLWGYPYQPVRHDMAMPGNMMSGDMKEMMDMMREHVRMTDEIRQVVYEINERCKRMERKMME